MGSGHGPRHQRHAQAFSANLRGAWCVVALLLLLTACGGGDPSAEAPDGGTASPDVGAQDTSADVALDTATADTSIDATADTDVVADTAPPPDTSADAMADTAEASECVVGEPEVALPVAPEALTLEATVTRSARCEWLLTVTAPVTLEARVAGEDAALTLGDQAEAEPGWLAPLLLGPGEHRLEAVAADTALSLRVQVHEPPPEELDHERSLVWIDPALVDDPARVGLRRVIAAMHPDVAPGPLLAWWFRRFSTTAHSERIGPELLLEAIVDEHGADPTAWDLAQLPFKVTAVHNRLDLADGAHCGEFRVSVASTHPLYQPFHLIFLFRQEPGDGDVSPGGRVHCAATSRRWAALSELDHGNFLAAAEGLLAENLTPTRFLLAESVEFTISPWEWRQWAMAPNPEPTPGLPFLLDNPPLFQTVDVEGLNQPGERRDDFLAWVADNAEALDQRRALLPEAFRRPSARLNAGVPWVPIDLRGLPPEVEAERPDLRRHIEIAGCPACHATDAEFIHTLPDRTFSPFYLKELDAREAHLRARLFALGEPAPFGPLQDNPELPP